MIIRVVLFLIINFSALALGSLLMNKGAVSDWYISLNKAPWTPPGWTFGAAWTLIMICFSFYMAYTLNISSNIKLLIILFCIQWVLNVIWNPVFFYYHFTLAGFIIIIALTVLIGFFMFKFFPQIRVYSLLILPYFIWLLIATTLNGYIVFKN